jgi:hypothetical protein
MNRLGLGIKFEWPVYLDYEIEEGPPPMVGMGLLRSAKSWPKIVARGSPQMKRPLGNFPDLWLRLAKLQPSPDNCLDFARNYGLLTHHTEEVLPFWKDCCISMNKLIELVETKSNWNIEDGKYIPRLFPGSLDLQFEPDVSSKNIIINAVPKNLNAALRLQCLSHYSEGGTVRACEWCGNLMEIGGSTGKRSHVKFCSDKCRSSSHHQLNRPRKTR